MYQLRVQDELLLYVHMQLRLSVLKMNETRALPSRFAVSLVQQLGEEMVG